MPELPEVETTRRIVDRHVRGDRITRVTARESGGGPRHGLFDDIVVGEGVTEDALVSALVNKVVAGTGRKGKQMWIELVEAPPTKPATASKKKSRKIKREAGTESSGTATTSLLMHLGMTGSVVVRGQHGVKYKQQGQPSDIWPPRFAKLVLEFHSGASLAFVDPRRLGRLLLRACPVSVAPVSELAPDPTVPEAHGGLSMPHAVRVLGRTSAPIKAVLLDQRRLVSGVGNWICDDVLLHSAIHPETPANALSLDQVERLVASLRHICDLACHHEADYTLFPEHWLIHVRWRQGPRGQLTLSDGRRALFSTVAGRTTVHIPAVQKKSGTSAVPPTQDVSAETPTKKREGGKQRRQPPTPPRKAPTKAGKRSVTTPNKKTNVVTKAPKGVRRSQRVRALVVA
eukprot:m.160588 g.160588  ORF g.160588 m.160588 type:complete len:401 (+) comp11964_c0_seq1:143-1345(+)